MESLTLPADLLNTKFRLERQWADLVYQGFWFSPLKEALHDLLIILKSKLMGLCGLGFLKVMPM